MKTGPRTDAIWACRAGAAVTRCVAGAMQSALVRGVARAGVTETGTTSARQRGSSRGTGNTFHPLNPPPKHDLARKVGVPREPPHAAVVDRALRLARPPLPRKLLLVRRDLERESERPQHQSNNILLNQKIKRAQLGLAIVHSAPVGPATKRTDAVPNPTSPPPRLRSDATGELRIVTGRHTVQAQNI